MSNILGKTLFFGRGIRNRNDIYNVKLMYGGLNKVIAANYSRRGDPKNIDKSFKIVKSKVRMQDNGESLGDECGPNWEILAPRGNRFYFPNAVGPAWQGDNSTIALQVPLELLVDFDGKTVLRSMKRLHFLVNECPSLIRRSLHELFPVPEVISNEKLTLVTLLFNGDSEQGARKFVLAAREISFRLRMHGYWADFMNPFSGKPFHSWSNNKNLYRVDVRFRGLNMKLFKQNNCLVITTGDIDSTFSGAIYTNAPSNSVQLKALIDNRI